MRLRPFQSDALQRLKQPCHLLCLAPTGSGKSLIYEKIASENGRRTLLITPLVALARQQAERLAALGVPVALHSGHSASGTHSEIKAGVRIMSPETLQYGSALARLASWRPDFLVVDECHCLYDWGESFRTAFMEIPALIRKLGIRRSLWLTATLPLHARIELEKFIGEPLVILGNFSLPSNLHLGILRVPWTHRAGALLEEASSHHEPGIVFVSTREATHRVSRLLSASGRRAIAYHAGMSREERCLIEKTLREPSDAVLVATSAFGMGMDYAHLLWAVLWQPPPSLLSLAQAVGRIGRRPELPAHARVLWDDEDFRTLQWMTQSSRRRVQDLSEVRSYLAKGDCRNRGLEAYFNGSEASDTPRCSRCDFCAASETT